MPSSGRGAGGEGLGGCFGLIATNTIGQGDTRSTGLRWICNHGGQIYQAQRRFKWPGQAAVVVSVVNVIKGEYAGNRILDNKPVETITAFLFHRGSHDNPATLKANAGKSFQGSIVLGMGFTFDDTDTKGVANSIADMHRLIEQNPKNAERIFPYIGGEEINTSPTHSHHRYVINFYDMPLQNVEQHWPELLEIVKLTVKPERDIQKRDAIRLRWWQYAEKRPGMMAAIKGLNRYLAIPFVSSRFSPAFLDSRVVLAGPANVIATESMSDFAVIQSRLHEEWTKFMSSSLEDRQRYTPSDCFETFPFPQGVFDCGMLIVTQNLPIAGEAYYAHRAALMVENNEGLTKTYNRFHDPDERSPKISKLRELHAEMDRAVLEAYGWNDLAATAKCEFLLDYEDEEEGQETSRRKKPWRYRWPDDFRDEVLARLLELNAQRAKEEALAGKATERTSVRKKTAKPNLPMLPGLE